VGKIRDFVWRIRLIGRGVGWLLAWAIRALLLFELPEETVWGKVGVRFFRASYLALACVLVAASFILFRTHVSA